MSNEERPGRGRSTRDASSGSDQRSYLDRIPSSMEILVPTTDLHHKEASRQGADNDRGPKTADDSRDRSQSASRVPKRRRSKLVKEAQEKLTNKDDGLNALRTDRATPERIGDEKRQPWEGGAKRTQQQSPGAAPAVPNKVPVEKKQPWERKPEVTLQKYRTLESQKSPRKTAYEEGTVEDSRENAQHSEMLYDERPPTQEGVLEEESRKPKQHSDAPPHSTDSDERKVLTSHDYYNRIPQHMTPYDYTVMRWLNPETSQDLLEDLKMPSDSLSRRTTFNSSETRPSWRAARYPEERLITSTKVHVLPPIIRNKDSLPVRIKVLRVRTLLMTCQLIARTAQELELSSEMKGNSYVYREYSKMYKHAEHALTLAKELMSDGLQARCFYWIARAATGQCEWHDADRAFCAAVDYDGSSKEDFGVDTKKQTGLRPAERADIEALRSSVRQQVENYETISAKQMVKDKSKAYRVVRETGKEFEEVVEYIDRPPRRPDLEAFNAQYADAADQDPRLSKATTSVKDISAAYHSSVIDYPNKGFESGGKGSDEKTDLGLSPKMKGTRQRPPRPIQIPVGRDLRTAVNDNPVENEVERVGIGKQGEMAVVELDDNEGTGIEGSY